MLVIIELKSVKCNYSIKTSNANYWFTNFNKRFLAFFEKIRAVTIKI